MSRAMGSHHNATTGSDVWLTPRGIIDALGPFDLDPCAAPGPRPWPTAAAHITRPEDGLREPWNGRIWCNPPYTAVWRWLARLSDHGDGIALIFARTETRGFVQQVWERADGILFIAGRVTFCDTKGRPAEGNAGAPSCFVAYGQRNVIALTDALDAGTLNGSLVSGWLSSTIQSDRTLFDSDVRA